MSDNLVNKRRNGYMMAIASSLREFPDFRLVLNKAGTKAFVYYRHDLEPMLIADRTKPGFKIGNRTFKTTGDLVKHASDTRQSL